MIDNKELLKQMREEARKRLDILKAPEEAKQIFENGNIPITVFSGSIEKELTPLHKKVLEKFNEEVSGENIPFYITESWHGCDIVSVLFVTDLSEEWEFEREEAEDGYHLIYSYNVDNPETSEIGSGFFSIEDGLLWRVY